MTFSQIEILALVTFALGLLIVAFDYTRQASEVARFDRANCGPGSSCPLLVYAPDAYMIGGFVMMAASTVVGISYYYLRAIFPRQKSARV
jgi:hypothetical protein